MKTSKTFVAGLVLGLVLGAAPFVVATSDDAKKWENDFWLHQGNPRYWPHPQDRYQSWDREKDPCDRQ
jgi:hypothetical protein